ncbi:MAG: hypothetical protein PsegKO_27610 [Pseudohongiellaceae bacterium]
MLGVRIALNIGLLAYANVGLIIHVGILLNYHSFPFLMSVYIIATSINGVKLAKINEIVTSIVNALSEIMKGSRIWRVIRS